MTTFSSTATAVGRKRDVVSRDARSSIASIIGRKISRKKNQARRPGTRRGNRSECPDILAESDVSTDDGRLRAIL
jgi:hypothetical protein